MALGMHIPTWENQMFFKNMSLHGFKLQTFRFRTHTPNVKCSNL